MRLDSIWDTEKGKNNYPAVKEALKKRFNVSKLHEINRSDVLEDCRIHHGYGTNTYTGKIKEKIKLSELELAMILDNGYSFFGGSSRIEADGSFEVKIWFD